MFPSVHNYRCFTISFMTLHHTSFLEILFSMESWDHQMIFTRQDSFHIWTEIKKIIIYKFFPILHTVVLSDLNSIQVFYIGDSFPLQSHDRKSELRVFEMHPNNGKAGWFVRDALAHCSFITERLVVCAPRRQDCWFINGFERK